MDPLLSRRQLLTGGAAVAQVAALEKLLNIEDLAGYTPKLWPQ
jgi:hypothetical protein